MTSSSLYFLFPRMDINSGGHIAQVKFLSIAQSFCSAQPVTYEKREKNTLFYDDLIKSRDISTDNNIYIIHWGPHIKQLLRKLKGRNIVYFAHSTGYNWKIPSSVPIVCVSKHTQAYWGRYAPNSLIFHLPNHISENYYPFGCDRTIDVLVQKRKSSNYLMKELIPALQNRCNLFLVDSWVEDLATLFNQAKIYLYDSSEYWIQQGQTEGFGLPPLEAMACGCTVFSSINDALSDYLDPNFNSYKLRVYSKDYDVENILKTLKNWQEKDYVDLIENYRLEYIIERFKTILDELIYFFDHSKNYTSAIQEIKKDYFIFFKKIVKKINS